MQRLLGRMSILMVGLMLVFVGVARADRDVPGERGDVSEQQAIDDPRGGYGPMLQNMRGMLRHMRGMLHDMEGVRGPYGRMQEDDDDDDVPQPGWCGMMGPGMMYGMHDMMGQYGRGHGHQMLRNIERLTADLDLSEQQERQIRALWRTHMKQAIQARAALAAQRIDLQERLDAEPVDMTKVKSLLQDMAAQQAELRFSHLSLMQEIKQQLTPEQQKKFSARQGYMMYGYGRHARGAWWGPGPMHRYRRELGERRGMRHGMGSGMGPGMGPGMRMPKQ